MSKTTLNVHNIAVIGAGVSGVTAGIHLKKAGLKVTIFERTSRAGGVWSVRVTLIQIRDEADGAKGIQPKHCQRCSVSIGITINRRLSGMGSNKKSEPGWSR